MSDDAVEARRRALAGDGWLTRDGQLLDSAEKVRAWLDEHGHLDTPNTAD